MSSRASRSAADSSGADAELDVDGPLDFRQPFVTMLPMMNRIAATIASSTIVGDLRAISVPAATRPLLRDPVALRQPFRQRRAGIEGTLHEADEGVGGVLAGEVDVLETLA